MSEPSQIPDPTQLSTNMSPIFVSQDFKSSSGCEDNRVLSYSQQHVCAVGGVVGGADTPILQLYPCSSSSTPSPAKSSPASTSFRPTRKRLTCDKDQTPVLPQPEPCVLSWHNREPEDVTRADYNDVPKNSDSRIITTWPQHQYEKAKRLASTAPSQELSSVPNKSVPGQTNPATGSPSGDAARKRAAKSSKTAKSSVRKRGRRASTIQPVGAAWTAVQWSPPSGAPPPAVATELGPQSGTSIPPFPALAGESAIPRGALETQTRKRKRESSGGARHDAAMRRPEPPADFLALPSQTRKKTKVMHDDEDYKPPQARRERGKDGRS